MPSIGNTGSVILHEHQFGSRNREALADSINIRKDLVMGSNRNDDKLDHKTVLITGIAGFIGTSLARALSNLSHTRIVGIDSFNSYYIPKLKRERSQKLIHLGVNVIFGDLCDEVLISDILESYNVSIVVHLAAQAGVRYSISHPHSYVRNNIDCTVYLLEVIRKKKYAIPIVYASSSSIYGDNDLKHEALKESSVYAAKSVYAASKVATENMASVYSAMYGLTMVGLRFFTVYGSYGRPDMALWSFADRLLSGEKIKLYNNGDMMRDFTHWTDVVDGIQLAMKYALKTNMRSKLGSNDVFNLGKGNVRSLREFVEILLRNLGMSTNIDSNPLIELAPTPGGEVLFTSADLTKSAEILGYNPQTELEEGIPEFIEWFEKDWKVKQSVEKKYLVVSTFYIAMTDPRRRQNDIKYSYDFSFAVEYINGWYHTLKAVMNADDLSGSQVDAVILHDGLSSDIFNHFADIVFVNMGQYPDPLQGHTMRRSPNDIRYFHMAEYLKTTADGEYQIVILTDLRDVMFGRNPFEYLEAKSIRDSNDLYVGCEVVPQQSLWSKYVNKENHALSSGVWYEWVHDRLNACFKQEIVDKCLKWIESKDGIPTNPGIVAANKETMTKYLDKIKYELTRTKRFKTSNEQNCNYAATLVSIVELCHEEGQCHVINDEVFHSPYREFKTVYHDSQHKNKWVIYHK
eukprot:882_1